MEAAPGQTVERAVQVARRFPDEAQRGKTKTVRVTLNDVKRKAVPPLDDAFAREVGDFDSLDALSTAVRTDLERTPSARAMPKCGRSCSTRSSGPTRSTCRRAGCTDRRGLRGGVSDP